MAIIQINNVSKSFGEKVALDKVSLEIPDGKIFGLLGPNGAGKTTLIRIINRITIPTAGSVFFQGRPITDEDVARIGYLPEERGLYRNMRVGEQALYLLRLKGLGHREAMDALHSWMPRLGMDGWWQQPTRKLSKGMQQRLQFLVSVAHNPRLLILDEPFSGLDADGAAMLTAQIQSLRASGTAIILSTHNLQAASALCDKTVQL